MNQQHTLVDTGSLRGRSLLTLLEFTPSEILGLVEFAARLKAERLTGARPRRLAGKNIALLFEKESTRTRCAFTVAAADEGAHAETLSKADIHLGAKEDVRDTARVLSRFFDGIQFRGFGHATVEALAEHASVPVWNGLTDEHHPTQALADLLTLAEALSPGRESENRGRKLDVLRGLKVCYLGDAANNTCVSLMFACAMAGVHFTLSGPEEFWPRAELLALASTLAQRAGGCVEVEPYARKAVEGAHALYTDVWISMGEEQKPYAKAKAKALAPWQVNESLMAATGLAETVFLHCLPAIKGLEVTEAVFESPASKVFDQAENRMHTIKALMLATLGVASDEAAKTWAQKGEGFSEGATRGPAETPLGDPSPAQSQGAVPSGGPRFHEHRPGE